MEIEFEEHNGCVFTRNQVEGAIKNGTRIYKCVYEKGDAHLAMAEGVVIGSLPVPPEISLSNPHTIDPIKYFYFIEWDDAPDMYIGVQDYKIDEVPNERRK